MNNKDKLQLEIDKVKQLIIPLEKRLEMHVLSLERIKLAEILDQGLLNEKPWELTWRWGRIFLCGGSHKSRPRLMAYNPDGFYLRSCDNALSIDALGIDAALGDTNIEIIFIGNDAYNANKIAAKVNTLGIRVTYENKDVTNKIVETINEHNGSDKKPNIDCYNNAMRHI